MILKINLLKIKTILMYNISMIYLLNKNKIIKKYPFFLVI